MIVRQLSAAAHGFSLERELSWLFCLFLVVPTLAITLCVGILFLLPARSPYIAVISSAIILLSAIGVGAVMIAARTLRVNQDSRSAKSYLFLCVGGIATLPILLLLVVFLFAPHVV
jgi:hypothetical protein